ncbi:hypothetical protein [Spirosoma utsteinense]|uniref:Outer membrane protein beta-barrel domain-containing protein n=1 Tax=Spirosoma utsteinense TaxID=2585773 RepID=A0ABR6WD51_9BACT|nr:hypothetical protein [Spirosoma utsteinense]MBC3788318.1 hypothetical protein [Spirosoma utsteinense]MBC3794224.1 hypothetical protein [Spirosoma utsteinense]
MNQYHLLLLSLLLGASTGQAQPAVAVNSTQNPAGPVPTEAAPSKPKATQSPVYFKAYGFYSLLTPGGDLNYSYSQTQSTTPTIYKATDKSLGAGPRAGVGLGFIVSDFINLGIDADILFGTPLTIDNTFFSGNSRYTTSRTTTLKVLSITPNITFKALSRPAYYLYNRLGLVGGVILDYEITGNELETPARGAVNTTVSNDKYTKNSLALGYQVAFGIQFRLSQRLRGFAEVVAYNQSFKPQEIKSTYTTTKSGDATTQRSVTLYKEQGDFNKSDPYEQPSFNVAINSIGVGAGLAFRF